ncbi:MAG: OFA family MFS transporter [Oscillospiraceae bacterium]|nr:OFA family MFS transporter [Oscillospiraceae bacterium]
MKRLNKRIVLISAVGVSIAIGFLYAWSVVSKGLINELGWTGKQASVPYTVYTVFMALGFFASGRLQDRLGPRVCVTACAVMMGGSLVLCGLFTTPVIVMLSFGVICGVGVGAGNAASLAPPLKWFPASKKGMVSGAVLAGIGFSAVLYSPLADFLTGAVGVSNAFLVFGALAFAIIFPLSFNIHDPPPGYDREIGRVASSGEIARAEKAETPARQTEGRDISSKEMLKTSGFWLMFAIFAFSSSSGLMIIAHAAKIAQVQAGWEGGFLLVIVLNLFNMAGRFLGGAISDKIGRLPTLRIILAVQALNMALFGSYSAVFGMAAGIAAVGFCYGTVFAVMPTLTADLFGLLNFGSNYGTLYLAWGIGGIIGPMAGAVIYDATFAYSAAYIIAGALSAVSLVLAFALRKAKAA